MSCAVVRFMVTPVCILKVRYTFYNELKKKKEKEKWARPQSQAVARAGGQVTVGGGVEEEGKWVRRGGGEQGRREVEYAKGKSTGNIRLLKAFADCGAGRGGL